MKQYNVNWSLSQTCMCYWLHWLLLDALLRCLRLSPFTASNKFTFYYSFSCIDVTLLDCHWKHPKTWSWRLELYFGYRKIVKVNEKRMKNSRIVSTLLISWFYIVVQNIMQITVSNATNRIHIFQMASICHINYRYVLAMRTVDWMSKLVSSFLVQNNSYSDIKSLELRITLNSLNSRIISNHYRFVC